MNWFKMFGNQKNLKIKNVILNDQNYWLKKENRLLKEQNEAYGIENFNVGREFEALKHEKGVLLEMIRLNKKPTQTVGEIERQIQEALTFTPHS